MLISLFKYKKRWQLVGCAAAVLVLNMMGSFFIPASAQEECATDFFSKRTCRSFDTPGRGSRQNSDAQESAAGGALWNNYPGLSGSQIWYRNPSDGDWILMVPRGWEGLGNRAIHGFRCLTDLFGNVACNRDQLILEVPLENKSPDQR